MIFDLCNFIYSKPFNSTIIFPISYEFLRIFTSVFTGFFEYLSFSVSGQIFLFLFFFFSSSSRVILDMVTLTSTSEFVRPHGLLDSWSTFTVGRLDFFQTKVGKHIAPINLTSWCSPLKFLFVLEAFLFIFYFMRFHIF